MNYIYSKTLRTTLLVSSCPIGGSNRCLVATDLNPSISVPIEHAIGKSTKLNPTKIIPVLEPRLLLAIFKTQAKGMNFVSLCFQCCFTNPPVK